MCEDLSSSSYTVMILNSIRIDDKMVYELEKCKFLGSIINIEKCVFLYEKKKKKTQQSPSK